jgi:predicted dehydrogenase
MERGGKMNVGIVGVGKLGNYHCNAITQLTQANLVGIYDTDGERCKKIAKTYRCKAFESYKELLNHVDIVGVIVPTTFHLEVASAAIKAKKHVFVEKPIAENIDQAKRLVQLAKEENVRLQVGHIERFNPAMLALNDVVLQPMFIESHRLAPFVPRGTDVAVVLDLMIHDIDIILSMVRSDVKKVDANGVAVVSDQIDIANTRLQFENGCVANLTASRISQKKMRKIRLFQRDAYISVDFLKRSSEIIQLVDSDKNVTSNSMILGQIEQAKRKRQILYNRLQIPESDAMQEEWKHFFYAIKNQTKPVVSGEDGLKALKVATQIVNIISQQFKPISLEDIDE